MKFKSIFSSSRVLAKISQNLGFNATTVEKVSSKIKESLDSFKNQMLELEQSTLGVSNSAKEIDSQASKSLEISHSALEDGKLSLEEARILREEFVNLQEWLEESNSRDERFLEQIEANFSKIDEVFEIVNDIAEKTKVIDDIVFQTKLLSFNASVEAARAGEHGKGFAVVSEEIGSLAASSGAASVEINKIIKKSLDTFDEIMVENKTLVQGLSSDKEATLSKGRQTFSESSEKLIKLQGSIKNLYQTLSHINENVEIQSSKAAEINSSIHSILANVASCESSSAEIEHNSNQLQKEVETLSRISSDLLTQSSGKKIVELSVKEASELLSKYTIVDVRRPDEWGAEDTGYIQQAELITLNDEFENKMNRLSKSKPIMLICRSGGRSARACRIAQRMGFKKVYNVEGGMLAWAKENLPRVYSRFDRAA